MAAHGEEDEYKDIGTSSVPHLKDVEVTEEEEEDEEEDQSWGDWEAEYDSDESWGSNPRMRCLFCENLYRSSRLLFDHCASVHFFDFREIRKSLDLDYYGCIMLINYVRYQVSKNEFWNWGAEFISKEDMRIRLCLKNNADGKISLWTDEKYILSSLDDDPLLYNFDEEDEEDGDVMSADIEELEIERINLLDSANHEETEKLSAGIMSNDASNLSSAEIVVNHIKNIDKNYFGGYSSFGIHRDMISDKPRTDTYRRAILENPSLIKNAVVMDVGCGTGILSLFAAQAGASKVIAVEASEKMASMAAQIAKDNGLLCTGRDTNEHNGVINVVQGMVEDLCGSEHVQPHSVDVLLSEWMGYCLLYESMLTSVLFARDKWLKPGGAILPDTATIFVAGFGRGGTCLPFWENVYGFNMSCIGHESNENASTFPIVDIINNCDIVSTTGVLQEFDLLTMKTSDMDFTSVVELEHKLASSPASETDVSLCHGLVLWFETGFTERFCRETPLTLSTSPYKPDTHWSQTILTFKEPIALGSHISGKKSDPVGSTDCPAVKIVSRISIVRASQHRSIDISMELTGIGHDGRKRSWPAQLFNLQ